MCVRVHICGKLKTYMHGCTAHVERERVRLSCGVSRGH